MFTLTEQHKLQFQNQVNNINEDDEAKVKDKIARELESLEDRYHKKPTAQLKTLIEEAKLLNELISYQNFPISSTSRKWIIFGLGYLVSDVDIIPDVVPLIGLLDDFLVISLVRNKLEKDLIRFEYFKKAIELSKSGKVLKEVLQGHGEQMYILLSGFIDNELDTNDEVNWVKSIRKIDNSHESPGVALINWHTNYLPEFSKTIIMMDRNVLFEPVFNEENLLIEWNQLKIDFQHLGVGLALQIEQIKQENPEKNISVIAIDAGAITLVSALNYLQNTVIESALLLGAAVKEDDFEKIDAIANVSITNYYSKHDVGLHFLNKQFDSNAKYFGLQPSKSEHYKINNIDCSEIIKAHFDYKYYASQVINLA